MKTYTFVEKSGNYQFNRQELAVFQAIRELGTATLQELAEKLQGISKKQTPERIVQYYMVNLKKLGLVTVSGGSSRKTTVTI